MLIRPSNYRAGGSSVTGPLSAPSIPAGLSQDTQNIDSASSRWPQPPGPPGAHPCDFGESQENIWEVLLAVVLLLYSQRQPLREKEGSVFTSNTNAQWGRTGGLAKVLNTKMSSGNSQESWPPSPCQTWGSFQYFVSLFIPGIPSMHLWNDLATFICVFLGSALDVTGPEVALLIIPIAYPQPLCVGLRGSDNREGCTVVLHLSPFQDKRGIQILVFLLIIFISIF